MSEKTGERITLMLNRNMMSIAELTRRSGVNYKSISAYIRGTRNPKMDPLIHIARTLDVSVDYLLGITDEPRRFGK